MDPIILSICTIGSGVVSCIIKDPVASATNLVLGVAAGMIANKSDREVSRSIGSVIEYLKNSKHSMPINHDIQRAVRRAYLEATKFVTETCMEKEFKVPLNMLKRDIKNVFFPCQEIKQLDNILEHIDKELKELHKSKYVPPDNAAIHQIELLLQPKNTPKEKFEEFKATLKNGVIAELCQWQKNVPDPLIRMIQHGWKENDSALDWFDLMCAFFNAILKNNTAVSTIIQTQLLAQLTAENIPITLESFQNEFDKLAGESLKIRKITIRIGLIVQDIQKDVKHVLKNTNEIKDTANRTENKIDHLTDVVKNKIQEEEELEFHLLTDRTRIPPVCSHLPKLNNMKYKSMGGAFVGRVSDLWKIYDSLQKGEATVVEGVGVVMGMGGLGKTQTAVEFVQRFGLCYSGGVFWIEAEHGIETMIAKIADAAKIQIDGKLETDVQLRLLWNHLNRFRKVLIVLDNFPEKKELAPWLPPANNIHILVTTRRRDLFRYSRIPLDLLNAEEGRSLLNSGKRQFDEKDAAKLVDTLGGLPLALELAKQFLNVRTSLYIEALLDEIKKTGEMKTLDIFAEKYGDQLPSGHVKAVGATIKLSWDLASDRSKQVLQAMSLLAPEPVPKRLLRQILDMPETGGLSDHLDDAIDELDKKLSLIINLDEDGDPIIHRLVAGFVKGTVALSEDLRGFQNPAGLNLFGQVVNVVENEMSRCREDTDIKSYYELGKIVPHADILLSSEFANIESIVDISNYISWHYKKKGLYHLAEKYGRISLKLTEKHNEPGSKSIALSKTYLGLVLRDLGNLSEAESLLREALESNKKSFEPGHPEIAKKQSNLALVLRDLGNLPEAESLLREAFESDKKSFEPGHPEIAKKQSNLALVLRDLGNLPEAESLMREALESDKKSFEPGHLSIAISQSNLAMVLKDLGNLPEAESLLREALESDKKSFEPGHPSIAKRQSNLANVLRDLGKLPEAEMLLREALESLKKSLGAEHPHVAIAQSNLALVLRDLGNLPEAESLLREALESDKKSFEPGHPSIGRDLHNLASVLKDMGKDDEAMALEQEAYESLLARLSPDHPHTKKSKAFLDEWKRG